MNTKFFNSKTIGKSLKEVAVDLIQTSSDDVVSRWYHSEQSADLFTWVDKGENVIKQQLSFHGQVVEWNCLEGIKTGLIIEADVEGVKSLKPEDDPVSETIKFDDKPHVQSVDLALDILQYVLVADPLRLQLIGNFQEPQDIKNMSSEEFVKRFGLSLKNYQNSDPGFWESCKKTFHSIFKKTG